MSTGYWSGLFSHVEERGCCRLVTAGGSCLPLLWWVVGLGSRWQIWIVAKLMLDRIISFVPFPPKCFFGICQVFVLSCLCPSEHPGHTPNTSLPCERLIFSLSQSSVSAGTFLKISVHFWLSKTVVQARKYLKPPSGLDLCLSWS